MRAIYDVNVAGTNISAALAPVLLGLSVTDNTGTHSDTATLDIDDTDGRIILPAYGAAVVIRLGWENKGTREVFRGTVDEIRSAGSKSGGRVLSICAKGVNTLGRAKEGQDRHFDNKTIEEILKEAGQYAGITQISVDPQLASIRLPYLDMRSESFLNLGERLGAMLGGNFRVQGEKATLARRAGGYTPSVSAAAGDNLIIWDITPIIGRARFKKARAKSYDMKAAAVVSEEADTDLDDADATITIRDLAADPAEAKAVAKSRAVTSEENAGAGTVEINGSTDAVPDGQCVLTGARPGIDGTYKIKSVTHNVSKGGGWTTSISLDHPQAGAGKDKRAKSSGAKGSGQPTEAARKIDGILAGGKK